MKLKLLLLMCPAVLLFAGCTGEGAMITLDYYFVNATDKTIEFEASSDGRHNPPGIYYSFSIAPGGQGLISGKYFPGRTPFFPFSICNQIRLSNGEKTVLIINNYVNSGDNIKDPLFRMDCYEEFSCNKRKTTCYRYTFTEEDFERGTPVTEE